MTLAAGKRLGSYEILALIGAGGMGEVYRARDTRLDRTVAIKVLPEHVASDPDFRQRFEREAKAISSLNHPHICTLYDVGREDGVEFLVMELLEGETVTQRLARGPMPFPQVLRYGVEIAEALDRAHRQGVTHRDLKPGNIMLTKTGAKLLDFGLAKLKPSPVQVSSVATAAPDLLTASGTILGTLQYMAPEQLDGKPVDHRADVFAFGAIVYEMATGRAAFEGDSQARLIGAILKDEPRPISALQPLSPPVFDALIATCLAKDPDERWQSVADVGRQLRLLQSGSSQPSLAMSGSDVVPAGAGHGWRRGWSFALTAVAVAAGAAATWVLTRAPPPEPKLVSRLLMSPAADAPLGNVQGYDIAISPDGRRIAYVAAGAGGAGTVIYVRELDDLDARRVPGTEMALGFGSPFFSADGRSIGFMTSPNELTRVSLDGGPALKIATVLPASGFGGGTWGPDDTVIFSNTTALYRVSAGGGGTPERLTPDSQGAAVAPVLLPGGRGVLFGLLEGDGGRVVVLDLETLEQRVVAEGSENAAYSPSGHLIFARGGTLMAQPFDLERLDVAGEAVALLQGVRRVPNTAADYALAANGTLVYVPGGEQQISGGLAWVDNNGRTVGHAVEDGLVYPFDQRLSPDGGRIVVSVGPVIARTSNDIWIYDLSGRPPILLAGGGSDNRLGVWSPDGTTVAFASNRDSGQNAVYTLPADGSEREPRLVQPRLDGAPIAWTDGELLVWRQGEGRGEIVAAHPDGAGSDVVAVVDAQGYPSLSHDKRWLAYASNKTGQPEIYVQRYPDGNPMRVSPKGGVEPLWSRDGRELYYWQGDTMTKLAARDSSGATLSFDPAVELFPRTSYFRDPDGAGLRSYDVAQGGRFLMLDSSANANSSTSIVVVQNWIEEVKRRVPVP